MTELRDEQQITVAPVEPQPPGLYPARTALVGRYAALEPLDPARHAAELFRVGHEDVGELWTYLPYGPFADEAAMTAWLRDCAAVADPIFYALRDQASGRVAGMASYLNIVPKMGSIEIGHIWFSPALQRTRQATELMFLMIRHALDDLGYRRMEWKCNAANAGSRNAALRLGFRFEGIFYQHLIVKGCNRDTAWFSILDREWPALREGFERWLAPENFDEAGRQRRSLADCRAEA